MFIYQSIDTPTLDRFNAVTHASTGMSLICCLLMAITGYVTFTDKTQGNILNNFSPDDFLINIARLCFGANMSTTSGSHPSFTVSREDARWSGTDTSASGELRLSRGGRGILLPAQGILKDETYSHHLSACLLVHDQ